MKMIGPHTKIDALLTEFPFLEDFLVTKSERFSLLKNKAIRSTMGKLATLSLAAQMGGIDEATFIREINEEIKKKTNQPGAVSPASINSKDERAEIIRNIIKDLHKGVPLEDVKGQFKALIGEIGAYELAQIEQGLITEGLAVEEVQRLCDVHTQVFKDGLAKNALPGVPAGHPVHTFIRENREAEKIIHQIRESQEVTIQLEKLTLLAQIEFHYLRKENQLFPLLEKRGISGPSKVMWGIDNEIRSDLKAVIEKLSSGKECGEELIQVLRKVEDMIYKEEQILFPMALESLSEEDWAVVHHGQEELGYSWITIQDDYQKKEAENKFSESGDINLDVGHLNGEMINLLLKHLPLEVSLVNENDEVVYYSQGKERIFPRSPAVIGRKVQNCHPQNSVHIVEEILLAFKAGTKDVAEFWIQYKGHKISIRYIAVRNAKGAYKGTLEVTQDITWLSSLEGERRLLDWRGPEEKASFA
mgnify:FL=1